jgi:hypothetical protein
MLLSSFSTQVVVVGVKLGSTFSREQAVGDRNQLRRAFSGYGRDFHTQPRSVVTQKCLSFICHSGLDPESIVFELDSYWSLSRTCRLDPTTGYGAGMTTSELI